MDEGRPPLDGVVDGNKAFLHLLILLTMTAQDESISLNNVENVIKIMGNAACQCADAFHLLCLDKLLFELFALLHVTDQRCIGLLQLLCPLGHPSLQFFIESLELVEDVGDVVLCMLGVPLLNLSYETLLMFHFGCDSCFQKRSLQMPNQDPGIRLTQTGKRNFQQFERHFGLCLKAVEKVVPPDLTH